MSWKGNYLPLVINSLPGVPSLSEFLVYSFQIPTIQPAIMPSDADEKGRFIHS